MTELTFLGTGNFLAPPGRYWNSFVLDSNVLVEPCPTALAAPPSMRLRRRASIDVVVISHFHADHCFGWPFFLQAVVEAGDGRTLHVVGPPGVEEHLAQMIEVGYVRSNAEQLSARASRPSLRRGRRYVAGGGSGSALPRRRSGARPLPALLRVPVRPGRQDIAYSGDVRPCARPHRAGDREPTCWCSSATGRTSGPRTHMEESDVRATPGGPSGHALRAHPPGRTGRHGVDARGHDPGRLRAADGLRLSSVSGTHRPGESSSDCIREGHGAPVETVYAEERESRVYGHRGRAISRAICTVWKTCRVRRYPVKVQDRLCSREVPGRATRQRNSAENRDRSFSSPPRSGIRPRAPS